MVHTAIGTLSCVFKSVLLVDFLTFACSSFCLRPSSADSSAASRSSWAGGLPPDEDIDESEADVGAAGEEFISRRAAERTKVE